MITLLPTSSCSGFYSHAPEVPRVLHGRVIGRYILFRGTFLLMSYIRAVVSHCPISMCVKNVVAQTRTGVFLASLNIAGVGSSRYDIDIMAISWECALYNRRTRRSCIRRSQLLHMCQQSEGMSGQATRPHHQMPYRIVHRQRNATRK